MGRSDITKTTGHVSMGESNWKSQPIWRGGDTRGSSREHGVGGERPDPSSMWRRGGHRSEIQPSSAMLIEREMNEGSSGCVPVDIYGRSEGSGSEGSGTEYERYCERAGDFSGRGGN
eukprot:CAMPEP_0180117952 /NCGR_PEP_ID=MMETSP0986-20121125/1196_1 /TAXON_ID=697907 /ORGANISM="non described non described, Strain CCMP2293" /LENGTH=116 /DNA_ID=CAMNT_0022056867 /DNA_START=353 /DNA_END=700 /DNA_ORIENTATION=+